MAAHPLLGVVLSIPEHLDHVSAVYDICFIFVQRTAVKFCETVIVIKLDEGGLVFAFQIYDLAADYTLCEMNTIQCKGKKFTA